MTPSAPDAWHRLVRTNDASGLSELLASLRKPAA
jgi:hypothetical protein